ncbi:thiol-disulfide oxidoreductase DCC family protein [Nocardiopsis mangrovi]|uniref:Thiol-disulfide oxidoreductase DCC family protein n=1 Tax=Nocardiopsis mangrovi TaxID=1179818 RepID=A0ABV9DV41_9ACTN
MTTTEGRGPVLVFDGDCAFCSSSVEFLQRHVAPGIATVPWQFSDLAPAERDRAQREVLLLHPDGRRVWGGVDAIAVLLLESPAWAPAGWALRRAPGRAVGAAVYRWVARHRHRMPGGTPACRVGGPT